MDMKTYNSLHRKDLRSHGGTSDSLGINSHFDNSHSVMPMTEAVYTALKYRYYLMLWIAFCIILSFAYTLMAAKEYTAYADIILAPSKQYSNIGSGNLEPSTSLSLDNAQVESQLEVLKSERVLAAVFESLRLNEAVQSANIEDRWNSLRKFLSFGDKYKFSDPAIERRVYFDAFASRVNVRRIGLSYVLQLSFRSNTPQESAKVVNSIAMQYLKSQIELKAASIQRGGEYLKGRIESTKAQLAAAEEGVRKGEIPNFVFPDADAQVISSAVPPLSKSSPKTGIILALGTTLAAFLASFAVIAVNFLDKTVKTASQIKSIYGLECFGEVKSNTGGKYYFNRKLQKRQAFCFENDSKIYDTIITNIHITTALSVHRTIGIFSWSARSHNLDICLKLAYGAGQAAGLATIIDCDETTNEMVDGIFLDNAQADSICMASDTSVSQAKTLVAGNGLIIRHLRTDVDLLDASKLLTNVGSNNVQLKGTSDTICNFPPIKKTTDTLRFCSSLDCCILVLRVGEDLVSEAGVAIEAMKQAGVKSFGFLLCRK